MENQGRLHVHLGEELKDRLKRLHGNYGELSEAVRELIKSYVGGTLMPIDPKINEYLDSGDDTQVIELLTQHLSQLRALRLQSRNNAAARRTEQVLKKGLKEGGGKTAAEKLVESMLNSLKGGMPIPSTKEGG